MNPLFTLLAATGTSRTYFELMRLRQWDQWWHWLLLSLGCLLVLATVVSLYWRDGRGLGRGKRWLLVLLRISAFVGLLVFFLDLQKRTEQQLVKNSRVVVLVDTSQSMGIADMEAPAGESKEPRVQQIVRAFAESPMLPTLQEKHDVTLFRFDETNQPTKIAMFGQVQDSLLPSDQGNGTLATRIREAKRFGTLALVLFAFAVVGLALHVLFARFSRNGEGESWALLVTVFCCIVGFVLLSVSHLRNDVGLPVAMGWADEKEDVVTSKDSVDDVPNTATNSLTPQELDWSALLEPRGGATRLGDAVRWVLAKERGTPLAAIGVVTDGNNNRGIGIKEVAGLAKSAQIPLFPIGIASELPPRNVRVVDLETPARVYPGDEFKMTGYLQAYGLMGESVKVQLTSKSASQADADSPEEVMEADLDVELGVDGEVVPVPIFVTPDTLGKRVYSLRVSGLRQEQDPDQSDNLRQAKVRIVDRKSRVLLIAGGPTREYRFLRNMLFRDKDTTVDVLLQTAVEGISQEADKILFDLPIDPADLFEYDTVVAFDPNWASFSQTQLDLLEQWVAEKAGGFVVVAGPVHMSEWAENRRAPAQITVVRQLYPVNFNASRIELGRYGSESAWPLEITDDGRTASFLNLTDEESDRADSWSQFAGVYGYYPVREVKPAATVFARYSDPQANSGAGAPPLIVGQFYGAGRVVFLGTGEFWRLRAVDTAFFERFYTKLIRYVSEGRLLRDSNRGLLLVDKDRAFRGDTIDVRASVVDAQFQPLAAPTIDVTLKQPNDQTQNIELRRADGLREGMYSGRFLVSQPGDYLLELTLPGDGLPIVLEREVRVKLPNLEIERPQRNDSELQLLADATGGTYFQSIDQAAIGDQAWASQVVSKRRETYLPGTPDREFQQKLRTWLLGLVAGALFSEWLIRRLNKLA